MQKLLQLQLPPRGLTIGWLQLAWRSEDGRSAGMSRSSKLIEPMARYRGRSRATRAPCTWQRSMAEATATAAEASREELKAVAASASAVLSRVVQAVLSALHHSRGTESTPTTGHRLLDTFFYPGEASWRTLCCSEQLPSPCPAHEDPGLLTAICNDTNALQAQLRGEAPCVSER